jgi:hypothetical protein
MLGSTNELALLLLLIVRDRVPGRSARDPERERGGEFARLEASAAGDVPDDEGRRGACVGGARDELPCADSLSRNSTNKLPNDCMLCQLISLKEFSLTSLMTAWSSGDLSGVPCE